MKYLSLAFLLVSFIIIGCSNDSTSSNNGGGNNTSSGYYPTAVGNSWTYTTPGGSLTRTITSTFSYNGKSYFMATDPTDTIYIRQSGTAYYYLIPDITSLGLREVKVMDETPNTTWTDTINALFFDVITTYKTAEVGITRQVNGTSYSNVLHMQVTLDGGGTTTHSDLYFAKGIGEIEDIEDGSPSESLSTYTLK